MNLSQKYAVERIVKEIVTNNKEKTLNELKRIIKSQIRLEISPDIASQVGIDEIIEIIIDKRLLNSENTDNITVKRKKRKSYEKVEEER